MKEDGSIEATNGTFKGTIYADQGAIGGFSIGYGHIGTASVTTDADGKTTVEQSEDGLFLYNDEIGFNAKDRQAIFGTWNSLGQPMLCRLRDTAKDNGMDVSLLPKYGIVFDIENSASGNFAFVGKGCGVLNGMMDGYAYHKITIDSENVVYNGYMDMKIANRFLVKATATKSVATLPLLSNVRDALAIGSTTPFCVRATVVADIGSQNFHVCGRYSQKSSDDKYPWNTEDYPVLVHWNGEHYEIYEMGAGDSLEVLLVYDPDSTATLNNWPTKYTARIINRLQ